MSDITDFRKSKDHFMAQDHHSPLTPEQQRAFSALSYYEERPDLRFELEVDKFDAHEVLQMQTSTGSVAPYERWGKIRFGVEDEPAELTLYRNPDGGTFFLPFVDTTSGTETYGSGRYIEVESLSNGKIVVDFNYAYNPYCAYNDQWSCPLTPFENRLQVAARAGEKNYKPE